MIVREKSDAYVLIRQHDHGLISGEFARYWAKEPSPLDPTLYAIANHDVAWQGPDASVRWNEGSGRPYSFLDYPVEPKLRAYREGLNLLEVRSSYAACLCSMHYASFVRSSRDAAEAQFREDELQRQEKLKGAMYQEELQNLGYNFRLLQLCDDLSLFVCLNEPGQNDHPWYKYGFDFEGMKFDPIWEDDLILRLNPNPFSEPFGLLVPYTIVEKSGRIVGDDHLELQITC